jgi:hypothetical protein
VQLPRATDIGLVVESACRKATRLRAVASENLTGMAGAADRSWMNALLGDTHPYQQSNKISPPRRNGLRGLGVGASRRLVELRLCGVTPLRGTRASRVGRRHTPSRRGPPRSPSRP